MSPGPTRGTDLDCIRWVWMMRSTEANARPVALIVDDDALLRMYASDFLKKKDLQFWRPRTPKPP